MAAGNCSIIFNIKRAAREILMPLLQRRVDVMGGGGVQGSEGCSGGGAVVNPRRPDASLFTVGRYQKLWKSYVKLRHLLANSPKVKQIDKQKLTQREVSE